MMRNEDDDRDGDGHDRQSIPKVKCGVRHGEPTVSRKERGVITQIVDNISNVRHHHAPYVHV